MSAFIGQKSLKAALCALLSYVMIEEDSFRYFVKSKLLYSNKGKVADINIYILILG
jgi:hypothetical protein